LPELLAECKRIRNQYPDGHRQLVDIDAQIADMENRISSQKK
jgi:hypothetical protein